MIERFFVFADPVSEHWFGSVIELCDGGRLQYMLIEIAAPDGESTEAIEVYDRFDNAAGTAVRAYDRFLALAARWRAEGARVDMWETTVCGRPHPEFGYCSLRISPGEDMCPECLAEVAEE